MSVVVSRSRMSASASPASLASRMVATRTRSELPYRRRPPFTRAGESSPMVSQWRSTCVARPKYPATSPILMVALDFMSTLSRSMARMSNEAIGALIPQLDAVEDSPGAAALRARSYELLRAAPGALVVDVGCGAGRAVAELADRGVGVTGIDINDQMITLARERWPHGEFRVGDAYALPLEDGQAAGYRADKVIHTLPDPGRALAE